VKVDAKGLLKLLLNVAEANAKLIPGGELVDRGVHLIVDHKGGDKRADLGEGLEDVVIGAFQAYEGVTEQDIVNDPVLAALCASVRQQLVLAHQLLVAKQGNVREQVPATAS
jgi:hypothetical protein